MDVRELTEDESNVMQTMNQFYPSPLTPSFILPYIMGWTRNNEINQQEVDDAMSSLMQKGLVVGHSPIRHDSRYKPLYYGVERHPPAFMEEKS